MKDAWGKEQGYQPLKDEAGNEIGEILSYEFKDDDPDVMHFTAELSANSMGIAKGTRFSGRVPIE